MAGRSGHHECQVFPGLRPEAEESEGQWIECQKNPGHLNFLPASDFINNHLPKAQKEELRKKLKSHLDLTVRLRVRYTSLARPDGFTFSEIRGIYLPRVGTGFIKDVLGPKYNKPCECHGRKQWEFHVYTAYHVVYDSDEALKTVIDVFYDDKESRTDGRMKSVKGGKVVGFYPDRDVCYMRCVTCDEDLGERIESAWRSYRDNDVELPRKVLEDLGLLQSCSKDYDSVLIVSHPHGQPKHVTVGELRYKNDGKKLSQYTTPTCPGSSGAPVFQLDGGWSRFFWIRSVHSGSYYETYSETSDGLSLPKRLLNNFWEPKQPAKQLNYGQWWFKSRSKCKW